MARPRKIVLQKPQPPRNPGNIATRFRKPSEYPPLAESGEPAVIAAPEPAPEPTRAAERGRPGEEPARRRRREGPAVVGGKRMPVPAALVEDKNYVYRLANDGVMRMHTLYNEGYDVVTLDGDVAETNSPTPDMAMHLVGTNSFGEPIRAVLMRKPKDLYEEDRKAKDKAIDEAENEMKTGKIAQEGGSRPQSDADVYLEGASITRGPL